VQQQVNPFIQQAMQMQQHVHPLMQQAFQHGQMMIGEVARVTAISQNMIPACDDLIQSITSGNTQRALATAQTLRGMSGQIVQSTQFVSSGIAQKMDTVLFILNTAHNRINEVTNAIQGMRPQLGFTGIDPRFTQYPQTVPPYMS